MTALLLTYKTVIQPASLLPDSVVIVRLDCYEAGVLDRYPDEEQPKHLVLYVGERNGAGGREIIDRYFQDGGRSIAIIYCEHALESLDDLDNQSIPEWAAYVRYYQSECGAYLSLPKLAVWLQMHRELPSPGEWESAICPEAFRLRRDLSEKRC